jgi:hypothetical protein
MWGKLDRGVLREVAHLLPEKLRDVDGLNPPHTLTFQNGFYEMARLLRHAGLPGGRP